MVNGCINMSYFHTCLHCDSNLDPNEKCDCEKEESKLELFFESHTKVSNDGQFTLII